MPTKSVRGQANCSWLIELGNGEKFVFDFGSGSQANFTALEIPHQDITAYFATHLHADHVGDFAQVWIGSWAGGRVKPLVLYGPRVVEARPADLSIGSAGRSSGIVIQLLVFSPLRIPQLPPDYGAECKKMYGKACVRETVLSVRIPFPPPRIKRLSGPASEPAVKGEDGASI
jgi:ribonuclease BN (tRNA processing enzyme)